MSNDILVFGGALMVIGGCYLIMPAMAAVSAGMMLMALGLARVRGKKNGLD